MKKRIVSLFLAGTMVVSFVGIPLRVSAAESDIADNIEQKSGVAIQNINEQEVKLEENSEGSLSKDLKVPPVEVPEADPEESLEEVPEADPEESPEETPEVHPEEPSVETPEVPPKEPLETIPTPIPEEVPPGILQEDPEESMVPLEVEKGTQILEEPEIVSSGTCGEDIQWILTADNTLTFVGSGRMYDYSLSHLPPYCNSLSNRVTSIVMDDEITHIGDYAFWFYYDSNPRVSSVKFPAKLESIGRAAFYYCNSLTFDSLPDGVKELGIAAFAHTTLSFSTLPEEIETISSQAFLYCNFLNGLSLPPSKIRTIGYEAFAYTTFSVPTVLEIPDNVEVIDEGAFSFSRGLTEVVLPNTLTSIGAYAFTSCEDLARVNWPENITEISGSAFSGCKNLTSFSIPEGVTHIWDGAFTECRNLTIETIPDSVTYIGKRTFYRCEKFDAALPPQIAYIGDGALCLTAIKSIELPSCLTYIGSEAFAYTDITEVRWPEQVTSIGDGTFYKCKFLKEVYLPETLESIGTKAFMDCISLTELILPNNVSCIGEWMAVGADSLRHIKVDPTSRVLNEDIATDLKMSAFSFGRAKNVRSITLPKNIKYFNHDRSWLFENSGNFPYAVFIQRDDMMISCEDASFVGKDINIYVPSNLYEEYMNDEAWAYNLEDGYFGVIMYKSEIAELELSAEHGIVEDVGYYELSDYYPGEAITLTATPDEGYSFVRWQSGEVEFDDPTLAETTFIMPVGGAVVSAIFAETNKYIAAVTDPAPIEVKYKTPAERLPLPATVEVTLGNGTKAELPVVWDTADYDSSKPDEIQLLTGMLTLGAYTNPNNLTAKIEVIVGKRPQADEIEKILPETMTVGQNIFLAPLKKENEFGEPTTEALPETVTVELTGGETKELPVLWETSGYDPAAVGKQALTGEVIIAEDMNIENPEGLKAVLEITVAPREYELWDASPLEISIEVEPGTGFEALNGQLQAQGKAEVAVQAVDLETDFEVFTFCRITLVEEDNPGYQKDQPGEYTLTARWPENFIPLAEDIPGAVQVKVTVPERTITGIETARMDAYQSVAPEHLENIPAQVNVTLEGGKVIPVDVAWDWREYAAAKDTAGEHIVLGELVNLPAYAKLPEGETLKPAMVVNTIPVNYEVSGVLSDNQITGDAGLALEELTAILSPTLTLEITSVTEGIELTTEYVVNVALEQEKNEEFDPELADVYILTGTLALPENITCPTDMAYEEMILETLPVEILSLEPVYALADEGTPFAELEGLPTQVMATLSCVGIDGENKKISIGADWGSGAGYTPLPEGLNDDNSVTMEVTGTLSDCPQYVNGAGAEPTLIVTMTRVFDLVALTPGRFPTTGELEVKLGSTLEDIYALLDTHSVELTLRNPRGETSAATVTFALRQEDNTAYDPMAEGTYTLRGYLPLSGKVRNPDNLGVEVVVKPTKYTISSVRVTRVTGVISGTPFEEIEMPSTVTVLRNDKKEDSVSALWNGSGYNPTKIGSQKITGTLVTPLPVHLENPNNRQPSGVITIVNPTARVLSLEQLPREKGFRMVAMEEPEEMDGSGLIEYRYLAQVLYENGVIKTEIISVFEETE